MPHRRIVRGGAAHAQQVLRVTLRARAVSAVTIAVIALSAST